MKLRDLFCIFFGFTIGGLVGFAVGFWALKISVPSHQHGQHMAEKPSENNLEKEMQDSLQQEMEHNKHIQEQIKILQKELEGKPDNYESLVKIANLYFDIESFQEAVNFYQKALAISAKDPNVITDLGSALHRLGKADEAVVQFQKAQALDPTHWRSLYNMIMLKVMQKKGNEEIRADYQNLLKLNNKEVKVVDIPFGIGMGCLQTGNADEAIFYLNEALKINPNHMGVINYLAQTYEKSQKNQEAAAMYEKLLQLLPAGHNTDMFTKKINALKQGTTGEKK